MKNRIQFELKEDLKVELQKGSMDIVPSFTAAEQRRVLERTDAKYASVPMEAFFEDRGVDDKGLKDLFVNLSKLGTIAGGFFESLLRGERPKDIDVFFPDAESFEAAFEALDDGEFEDYELKTDSGTFGLDMSQVRFVEFSDVKGLKPSIQLIKTCWYPTPEAVIDSFDFTAAQFAIHDGKVIFNALAPLDVARKRLVLHRMTFPASTLRRMIKYTQKGYYVCPGSIQRIAQETHDTLQAVGSSANGPVYID